MNRRKKYRFFVICCLALDLLAIFWLGYKYLDRKIPDEIQISRDSGENTEDVTEVLSAPLVTFEKAVTVSQDGGYILPCRLLGYIPFKEVKVTPVDEQEIYVSGSTIGIYMETEGVLVIDTGEIEDQNGEMKEPAKNLVRQGDYIVSFNGEKISTKRELINDIAGLDGEEVTLEVKREGESVPVSVTPVKDTKGDYKLGIWVRDDTQGIGTLTYVDQNGRYGALGHGISDIDTAQLLNIRNGALYKAQILAINKGSKGNPGELAGFIRYDDRNILGSIEINSKNGIYGQFYKGAEDGITLKKMPVAYKQDVKTGEASVLCNVDGEVREYQAEIKRIDLNHEDTNKSFVIQITDEKLLEKTGGIVQGLSGSPVLQNGKMVGAITHVFVQDSTSGYGIFIENMLGK
ncbi:SpoIVB peptidase [Blautia sp. HCN-1074]|uniref:SpoIVB peptidase n=1 Tax=Blautia sp. HCN-1074 TaxID=3134667 RepID=UPI001FA99E13